jgi:hypothetical protein
MNERQNVFEIEQAAKEKAFNDFLTSVYLTDLQVSEVLVHTGWLCYFTVQNLEIV